MLHGVERARPDLLGVALELDEALLDLEARVGDRLVELGGLLYEDPLVALEVLVAELLAALGEPGWRAVGGARQSGFSGSTVASSRSSVAATGALITSFFAHVLLLSMAVCV